MSYRQESDYEDIMANVLENKAPSIDPAAWEPRPKEKTKRVRKPGRSSSRKWIILASLMILSLILLGTKIYIDIGNNRSDVFPAHITKKVNFPLYYPRNVSSRFTLKENSLKLLDNNTVIYIFTYDSTKELTITLQQLPDNFQTSILSDAKEVENNLGDAYIGDYGEHPVGIIITEQTLIFLNDPSNTDEQILKELIRSY